MASTSADQRIVFDCEVPRRVAADKIDPFDVKKDLERYDEPLSYWSQDGSLVALAFPVVFYPDYFYAFDEQGTIHIDTDLKKMVFVSGATLFDESQINQLIKRQRCDSDASPIKGVSRFGGYAVYSFEGQGIVKTPMPMEAISEISEDVHYERFKALLNETVDSICEKHRGKNNILLMSGGSDSRLLYLLLKKKGIPFSVRTLLNSPVTHSINYEDVSRVQAVCDRGNISCRINTFDYRKSDFDVMRQAPLYMPNCVHDWVGFYYALLDADDDSLVWTGQNADAMYNFGPTERFSLTPHGIAQWFKRFYLSSPFLKSLPDVEGGSTLLTRVLAYAGLAVFKSYFRNQALGVPGSFCELEQRFSDSDDFLVLRKRPEVSACNKSGGIGRPIDAAEALHRLLRIKIDHCHGGKAQVISATAAIHSSSAVFPYSSCRMMSWFESLERGRVEVNHPKRFIYRYIEELSHELGEEFGDLDSKPSTVPDVRVRDLYGYFTELLNSQFGQTLLSESGVPAQELNDFPDDMRKYEYILCRWWVARLRKEYLMP